MTLHTHDQPNEIPHTIEGARMAIENHVRAGLVDQSDAIVAALLDRSNLGIAHLARSYVRAHEHLALQHDLSSDSGKRSIQDITDIALDGRLSDESFEELSYPGTHDILYEKFLRRAALVELYAHNKALAIAITQNKIVGIHGATSSSLPSIAQHGLLPLTELRKRGITPPTGEKILATPGVQECVSFVQWHRSADIKECFSEQPLSPEKLQNEILQDEVNLKKLIADHGETAYTVGSQRRALEEKQTLLNSLTHEGADSSFMREGFPVIYGINLKGIAPNRQRKINSSIATEFLIHGGVPNENIEMIFVPKEKITVAKKLLHDHGASAEVFPLEDFILERTT